jgi:hypothetical protein
MQCKHDTTPKLNPKHILVLETLLKRDIGA